MSFWKAPQVPTKENCHVFAKELVAATFTVLNRRGAGDAEASVYDAATVLGHGPSMVQDPAET